jgi:hypothetical protein
MRLPSLVLQRVREAVGRDYPVGVRFDAEECIKNGYGLPDACEFAIRFAELGAAYLSLSAGGKFEDALHQPGKPLYPYTGYSGDRCMPGQAYPDACNIHLAAGIRAALRARGLATPVVGSGKIARPELAERLIAEGSCDIVGMARALLADPWWPRKLRTGKAAEIVRCIHCNVCKNLDENFKQVRCYLWPRDAVHAPRPAEAPPPDLAFPGEAPLQAAVAGGRVRLTWPAPSGPAQGYDVFRAEDGCSFDRLVATTTCARSDDTVVGGRHYAYYVQAWDRAGRRGLPSNLVELRVPHWQEEAEDE